MTKGKNIWIGMAYVEPGAGSAWETDGLVGGYGFVACKAEDILECVGLTREALKKDNTILSGYEWLSRLDLYEGDLNEYQVALVGKLKSHDVQYDQFDWFGKAH